MPVATVGSPQAIALGAADALIVSCSAVDAVASVAGSTGFIGAPYELGRVVGETGRKFGPYGRAVSLIVSSLSGSITAEVSQPSRVGEGADALSTQQGAAAQGVVSGAGNPTDLLTGTQQHVTITGAISTTIALTATATGTYYKARVAWNNNGASASAKLRIAVNTDNDVHGLMVGQSAKRRDYEMTMGDGVMLVCGVPITRLTFSADGAITGGTHQLQVTFGN